MTLSKEIKEFVTAGLISEEQAISLNRLKTKALENRYVRWYIAAGEMTFKQALKLTQIQLWTLETHAIYDLIIKKTITLEQALQLSDQQRRLLENSESIRELITLGFLPFDLAILLNFRQRCALESQSIRELIMENTITIEQAIQLTYIQIDALNDQEIVRRLINGELTLAEFLAFNERNHLEPEINQGQSTHTTSVHESTSESATKLSHHYKHIVIENIIDEIRKYVTTLPDSLKNTAAKRCIARITANDYDFTDPASNVSIREILAFSFAAIHDNQKRMGSLEDAKIQFIEGLYEIQRGYNLSSKGIDNGDADREICKAGTFNKIIEKLQAVHPDCGIRFITNETAAFKLPKVVQEESMKYLAQLSNPQNVKNLLIFTRLIEAIKYAGVDVIWGQIHKQVSNRMFDEFGCLYKQNNNDDDFISFIATGKDLDLTDLQRFQDPIQHSQGYHEYCLQTLRHHRFFVNRNREVLINNRHSAPKAQKEYDQQFGLVVFSPPKNAI